MLAPSIIRTSRQSTTSKKPPTARDCMELVEGETLADRIARGPIPVDEALPIAKQIAEALEAAHEQGIIHRDLKPANIKVTPNGDVKVLDFGLAKLAESAGSGQQAAGSPLSLSPTITSPALMTGVGVLLGTAAYMAPEQARGKTVDKRADIWAFGAVLYEMLTGQRVFAGEDVSDTLANVLKSKLDWTRLPSELPPSIAKLLRLCLQKDVKKRRQSAGDVRVDLDDALAEPLAGTPVRSARYSDCRGSRGAGGAAFAMFTVRYLGEAPSPSSSEMRLQINTPLTSSPLQFSLSPDGLKLAFVASGDGAERLWLRALDKTDAQPMAGTEGAQYPFWSPDSRSIGFFASGKLYRIDSAGGTPQALANAPAAVEPRRRHVLHQRT